MLKCQHKKTHRQGADRKRNDTVITENNIEPSGLEERLGDVLRQKDRFGIPAAEATTIITEDDGVCQREIQAL